MRAGEGIEVGHESAGRGHGAGVRHSEGLPSQARAPVGVDAGVLAAPFFGDLKFMIAW